MHGEFKICGFLLIGPKATSKHCRNRLKQDSCTLDSSVRLIFGIDGGSSLDRLWKHGRAPVSGGAIGCWGYWRYLASRVAYFVGQKLSVVDVLGAIDAFQCFASRSYRKTWLLVAIASYCRVDFQNMTEQ